MAVIDTLKVNFEAEWTGAGAIARMNSDLQKVGQAAGNVSRAFSTAMGPELARGFDGVTRGSAEAAVALQTFQARSSSLKSEMMSLGSAVNSGKISFEDATAKYASLTGELAKSEGAIAALGLEFEKSAEAAEKHGMSLGELVSKYRAFIFSVTAVVAGVKGVAAAFNAVQDASAYGAGVNQMSDSFKNLSDNIVEVPMLLSNMRAAARGTISDMQLMTSFMTLVAGTSEGFGKTLANQAPALLEIAKAAQKLNPSLGDTAFLFDSLARGIKRSEIRILDNLGIIVKVGEANKKYAAEIGKSVLALTAEEKQIALLNETLRVGTRLIEQAGGSIDSLTDPYAKATAATQNFTDAMKGLTAVIFEGMFSNIASGLELTALKALDAKQNVDLLRAALEKVQSAAKTDPQGVVSGLAEQFDATEFGNRAARNAISSTIQDIVADITEGATSMEQARGMLKDAFPDANYINNLAGENQDVLEFQINGKWSRVVLDMDEISRAIEMAAIRREMAIRAAAAAGPQDWFDRHPEIVGESSGVRDSELISQASRAMQLRSAAIRAAAKANQDASQTYAEERRIELARNDAIREAIAGRVAAWEELENARDNIRKSAFFDILDDGESDLIVGNVKNLGQALVVTTNATDEQKRALEAWKEEQQGAADTLWELENGIGTFGVAQDKLAEKIADVRGEMEHYKDMISEVEGQIKTSTSSVMRYIDFNEDNAYRGIVDSMEDAGATSQQIIGVAESLGLIEPAAAEAARAIGLVELAIDLVGKQITDGVIKPEEAREAIDALIAQLEGGKTTAEVELEIKYKVDESFVGPNGIGSNVDPNRTPFLPEGSGTAFVPLDADLSPLEKTVGQINNYIPGYGGTDRVKAVIDADTSPAMAEFNSFRESVENTVTTVDVKIEVDSSEFDNWKAANSGSGGGGGGGAVNANPYENYHSGGFITGNGGGDIPAYLQAGEYVMRRSAVDKLGVPLLDRLNAGGGGGGQSNSIQIAFNYYGQQGAQGREIAPVLIQTDDPLAAIANTLRRSGVSI